jgi:butyrate kinase
MLRLFPMLEGQIRQLGKIRPTLIFPEGEDPRIVSAVSRLTDAADIVLVGRREVAERLVAEGKATIYGSHRRYFGRVHFVLPENEPALCDEFFQAFWEISQGRRWAVPYERATQLVREPVMFACMATRLGYADAVLGGVAHTSQDFFRPALRLLHTDKVAFEVGLFSLPDEHPGGIYQQNLVGFADVAINQDPPGEVLAEIAVHACKIVRDLVPVDVLPYVNGAILSYSTRGSGTGASVERIRRAGELIPAMLAEIVREDPLYETIRIEAELQISCAISIAAAQSKLHGALADPNSPLGRANVLIAPSLDTGNILYHLYATRYPDADRVLMVGGMDARVLDFSRSATVDDIALGAMATTLRLRRRPGWKLTPRDHFFPRYRILVVNPGSTSTKIALFKGQRAVIEADVPHPAEELAACETIQHQLPLRQRVIEERVRAAGVELDQLDAIVARGGLIRPVVSGTYEVDEEMLADLAVSRFGEHASNLAPGIAWAIGKPRNIPVYTVDPVVVDELADVSRVTGVAGYERRAVWHALSQKAVAKLYADRQLTDYENMNLIVAHMGGGVTVGCHRRGRCTYVNDGLDEGPMTPERAGSVPHSVVLDLCFRQGLDEREARARLVGRGGLVSHLGTADLRVVEQRLQAGDPRTTLVFEAMVESIAAQIAASVVRFQGEPVDQIVLTGGMTHCERLVERLRVLLRHVGVGVTVFPGEREAEALRDGAIRVLRGSEKARRYGRSDA